MDDVFELYVDLTEGADYVYGVYDSRAKALEAMERLYAAGHVMRTSGGIIISNPISSVEAFHVRPSAKNILN